MRNLMRRKDPERFQPPGIDPAWWCVPIVIVLALGLLHVIFQWDSRTYAPRFSAPAPQELERRLEKLDRPEKPDPSAELAEELKKGELKKDAAVTQPSETLSPYEAAIRQQQKR